MKQKIQTFLRSFDGPLTQQLLRTPGQFGLGQVPKSKKPNGTSTVVCGYCSTGCGLKAHLFNGEALNLSATTEYPVNLGMACPKGWEALKPLESSDRATDPLLKNSKGKFEKISWDQAANHFVDKMKAVQDQHGPESVAFISTGQIPFEEMAALGAFAKFNMGVKHGDGNTRQCMATAVVAYKQSFGFDAPPYTYKDFEESEVMLFVGANPCIAHPIMWERVMKNPHQPEIIVIDPRKTETAMCATQHLPLAPKSDLDLFYGIANELIKRDKIDSNFINNHTEKFEEFKEFLQDYTIENAAEKSQLDQSMISQVVDSIASGKRVSIWWTMGVNQSYEGVRLAQSLINIALMTGNIGKPGTGANSITGQCNAMGSRLFSNTTNLLGGHDFTSEKDRLKVAQHLGIEVDRIPQENSWSYDKIVDGISSGKIKALWVIATNNAHSWIGQIEFKEILKKLDFLVVQDMYHSTETAKLADLVLPAAGWGEKDGLFINSERRLGRIKRIRKSPGNSLADFYIFKLLDQYWGTPVLEDYPHPESLYKKLRDLTVGQPCDMTGIEDYHFIESQGGVQWPLKKGDELLSHERRLFEDGQFYTPNSKAQFIFEKPGKPVEPTDSRYPFTLLTGRGTSSQWHTQTRTSKVAILKKLYPAKLYVEVNPEDAERLKLDKEEFIWVRSRRNKIKAKLYLTHIVAPGQVFIPMHYHETNTLTAPQFDPYSRQPSYKHAAVTLEKIKYWEE